MTADAYGLLLAVKIRNFSGWAVLQIHFINRRPRSLGAVPCRLAANRML